MSLVSISKINGNWAKTAKTKIIRKITFLCPSETKGLIDNYHVNSFKNLYHITYNKLAHLSKCVRFYLLTHGISFAFEFFSFMTKHIH